MVGITEKKTDYCETRYHTRKLFPENTQKEKRRGGRKGEKGDNYGACSCPTHELSSKTLWDLNISDLRLTVTVTPRRNIKGFSHTMICPGGSENKGIYVLKEFSQGRI